MKWLLRQLFIMSGPWTAAFLNGLCLGTYTVAVPQMRKENQTVSTETASWLPTAHFYGAVPWLVVLACLSIAVGRKNTHIVVCTSTLIGSIISYRSTDVSHVLISEIFQSASAAATLGTSALIVTEFTHSKYRGTFLTLKSATFFWGILFANAIGTFYHWKNIMLLGIICSVYALINVSYWPESPYWLAMKGRLDECTAAHRWLKGDNPESEKELQNLIQFVEKKSLQINKIWSTKNRFKILTQRQFQKPAFLAVVLTCLYTFSGKLACAVYALEILKKITATESAAYCGMLILDGVSVISMYIGCILCRITRRRVMLFVATSLGIAFLAVLSGFIYLVKLSIFEDNVYVIISLLAAYSLFIGSGPIIMCVALIGELLPLESRVVTMCITGLTVTILGGTMLRIMPLFFQTLGMHGTFLLLCVVSSIILVMLFFYLPETKDKTIQEINDEYKENEMVTKEETSILMRNNA